MAPTPNETHLMKKHSAFPTMCMACSRTIPENEQHYVEEGTTQHIHSLIARKYCADCYAKHGEELLHMSKTA